MALDVLPRDAVDATLADGRRDADALHRLTVLPIRQPRPLDRQAPARFVSDLVDGAEPLLERGAREKRLRLDQSTQSALRRLRVRTVGLASRAHLGDAPIDAASVGRRPTPIERAPLDVESPGPVWALHEPKESRAAKTRPRVQESVPV